MTARWRVKPFWELVRVDTPLGLLNRVLLQWFFVRLAKVVDVRTGRRVRWTMLLGVCPLTGWSTPYRFIGRRRA